MDKAALHRYRVMLRVAREAVSIKARNASVWLNSTQRDKAAETMIERYADQVRAEAQRRIDEVEGL
jgi:hypothetical protein